MAASGDLTGGGGGGDDEAAMRDWEEGGRFSFEDSDRFEEDSLCSWSSEPESLCNNWRGWKRPPVNSVPLTYSGNKKALSEGTYLNTSPLQMFFARIPFVRSRVYFSISDNVFMHSSILSFCHY